MMPRKIELIFTIVLLMGSCNSLPKQQEVTKKESMLRSNEQFLRNIRKSYPYSDIKLDSSTLDSTKYTIIIYPDTNNCKSFEFNRLFIGMLDNIKTIVYSDNSSNGALLLQSGNLKLWPCSLPEKIKANDTVIVTGLVYDVFGNEKVSGYPIVLTKIQSKF